ncbi:unnamed protein product [Protopolystoma xenopodis]|uniref:Uncharacterized protein n=1 Tax=Protopolystoma xenopodis TaxID=117903 RepID=A0A3S5AUS9_9PLAT|nr:unnamed protein product [Protopolystoma xenopodis]
MSVPLERMTSTSGKGSRSSSSTSIVNLLLSSSWLMKLRNSLKFSLPCDQIAKYSSKYRMSTLGCSGDFSNSLCNLSLYAFAKRGESGDPIGNPNNCSYILPLNVKYVVLTVRLISRVNDSFRMRSASRMSSSCSNISSNALTGFSPEMFAYMDFTSKLTSSSDPTNPVFWIL